MKFCTNMAYVSGSGIGLFKYGYIFQDDSHFSYVPTCQINTFYGIVLNNNDSVYLVPMATGPCSIECIGWSQDTLIPIVTIFYFIFTTDTVLFWKQCFRCSYGVGGKRWDGARSVQGGTP